MDDALSLLLHPGRTLRLRVRPIRGDGRRGVRLLLRGFLRLRQLLPLLLLSAPARAATT